MAFRIVHIASCCFLVSPSWRSTGWTLLKSLADFPRDFLLPAPAANCNGCLVRHRLRDAEQSPWHRCSSTDSALGPERRHLFWTPHPARSFLPSATAAMGVPKEQRDCPWRVDLQKLVIIAQSLTPQYLTQPWPRVFSVSAFWSCRRAVVAGPWRFSPRWVVFFLIPLSHVLSLGFVWLSSGAVFLPAGLFSRHFFVLALFGFQFLSCPLSIGYFRFQLNLWV